MKYTVDPGKVMALVKRHIYLLWQACGGPAGFGVLQDMHHKAHADHNVEEEDRVFNAAYNQTDYPGETRNKPGKVFVDYCIGRMMKTSIEFSEKEGWVEVFDQSPSPDYQAWCHKYKTADEGLRAAAESLDIELTPVEVAT